MFRSRMNRNSSLLGFIFLSMALLSCQQSFYICGTTDALNIDGRMVSLKIADALGNWHTLDSCEVTHGSFDMEGNADSVQVATLFVEESPLMPVIVEPGNIELTINSQKLFAAGTRLNNRLYAFIEDKANIDKKVSELEHAESQMIMKGLPDDYISHYVDSAYISLSDEMSRLVTGFISDNYSNVLSLCGLSMIINGLPRPVITPLIQKVLDTAPQSFKDNPFVRSYIDAAEKNKGLADIVPSY